jgi:hypothetical protein
VIDERTVSATTVAASSGATQQIHMGSSSETDIVGKKTTQNDNLLCNKCGKKGTFLWIVMRKLSVSTVAKDISQ